MTLIAFRQTLHLVEVFHCIFLSRLRYCGHTLYWFALHESQTLLAAVTDRPHMRRFGVSIEKVEDVPEQGSVNMPAFQTVMHGKGLGMDGIPPELKDF